MKRCPICCSRIKDKFICDRCDADLKDLYKIEHQARLYIESGLYHILSGNIKIALTIIKRANFIHQTTLSKALLEYCAQYRKVNL